MIRSPKVMSSQQDTIAFALDPLAIVTAMPSSI